MKFTESIVPGQYFGEVELLRGEKEDKRLHKVVCLKHSHVLILNKREFRNCKCRIISDLTRILNLYHLIILVLDLEDLQKIKHALHDNVLEDPDIMKKKLLQKEQEKRELVSR